MKPLFIYANNDKENEENGVPIRVNRESVVLHLCLTDTLPFRYEIFEDLQEATEFCRQMPDYSMKGVVLYFSESTKLKKEYFKVRI
tara:strand:- start:4098 stop:4355 length:258 start_codon:yes stop_codon:yes gene_type:complete